MNQLHIQKENSISPESNNIIDRIYNLRYETFIQRLEWSIDAKDGRERDQFDDLDPYHIAITREDGNVEGCWRALPTTGEYMIPSVFPEILQGENAPSDKNVWEISRFAVRKGNSSEKRGYMSGVTLQMVKSFWEFAKRNAIDSYVTVTSVACERLLRQLGVNIRRMGEGKVMQIGEERSVALWINVDERLKIVTH